MPLGLTSHMHMQLAINNVLSPYLGNTFGFSTVKAANFAATFGLMNFWARPLGGFLSDFVGSRYYLQRVLHMLDMCNL